MKLFKKDLEVERLRRSGPGGQHRNRRATGIRLTHVPSGIVVMETHLRSQSQNLFLAKEELEKRFEKKYRQPKKRKKTKPPKRARENRLLGKRKQSMKKRMRQKAELE